MRYLIYTALMLTSLAYGACPAVPDPKGICFSLKAPLSMRDGSPVPTDVTRNYNIYKAKAETHGGTTWNLVATVPWTTGTYAAVLAPGVHSYRISSVVGTAESWEDFLYLTRQVGGDSRVPMPPTLGIGLLTTPNTYPVDGSEDYHH